MPCELLASECGRSAGRSRVGAARVRGSPHPHRRHRHVHPAHSDEDEVVLVNHLIDRGEASRAVCRLLARPYASRSAGDRALRISIGVSGWPVLSAVSSAADVAGSSSSSPSSASSATAIKKAGLEGLNLEAFYGSCRRTWASSAIHRPHRAGDRLSTEQETTSLKFMADANPSMSEGDSFSY